jgi:hypothetical protein
MTRSRTRTLVAAGAFGLAAAVVSAISRWSSEALVAMAVSSVRARGSGAAQRSLDLVQVLAAMLGPPPVERGAGPRIRLDDRVAHRGHPPIHRLGDREGKLGGHARREGQAERLRGIVDPVDVALHFEGWGPRGTSLLPLVEQDRDPLIPEGGVRKDRRHRPAGFHRTREVLVSEAPDKGAKPLPLRIVLGHVRAIDWHGHTSRDVRPQFEANSEMPRPAGRTGVVDIMALLGRVPWGLTLAPEDAFGAIDPGAFQQLPKARFPASTLYVGYSGEVAGPGSSIITFRIHTIADDTVTINLNHPLAGEHVVFDVTVVHVQD